MWFVFLDTILNNNEASSSAGQASARAGSVEDNELDRTSIGCKISFEHLTFKSCFFLWLALDFRTAVKTVRKNFPVSSYSSSDDDDFYDADEAME